MILCNPHNPTGRLLTPGQVLRFADATPARVLVDEAFIDLTDVGEAGSVIAHVMDRSNLVVVRSLTKFYAMPGLRVGYAVAPPPVVAHLDSVRDPWSVSPAAAAAARAALEDQVYTARVRAWVRTERPYLAGRLAALPGYCVEPPSANFVLVRDCRTFEGLSEHHMRLAVRSRAENDRLLEALQG